MAVMGRGEERKPRRDDRVGVGLDSRGNLLPSRSACHSGRGIAAVHGVVTGNRAVAGYVTESCPYKRVEPSWSGC